MKNRLGTHLIGPGENFGQKMFLIPHQKNLVPCMLSHRENVRTYKFTSTWISGRPRHIYPRDTNEETANPPRLLAGRYGDKLIEIVDSVEKKNFFLLGLQEQPRQCKNLLYRHEEPNEPTK